METIKDELLLEQLKSGENAAYQALYSSYFSSVASYVKQNMGSSEDAEDIFQEAVIVLLLKVRQPDFVLTSALKTYLYAIAKNTWLKRLRSDKRISVEDFERYQVEAEAVPMELQPEASREEKVSSWLARITANCQRILKAIFYNQEPMEEVMKSMGWKNKHVAANQQYKCIQQVKKEKEKGA